MKFIQGLDRNQASIFPITLEQSIDEDNEDELTEERAKKWVEKLIKEME